MERPTTIKVDKTKDKVVIYCIDEETGSANSIDLPINAYYALAEHFAIGAMEISSTEVTGNCNIPLVSVAVCGSSTGFNCKYFASGYCTTSGMCKYKKQTER